MRSQHLRTLLFFEYIVKLHYNYSNLGISGIKQQESLINESYIFGNSLVLAENIIICDRTYMIEH